MTAIVAAIADLQFCHPISYNYRSLKGRRRNGKFGSGPYNFFETSTITASALKYSEHHLCEESHINIDAYGDDEEEKITSTLAPIYYINWDAG